MSCDGCEDCKTRKTWERQCDVGCEECKTHPWCGSDWDAFASVMAYIHGVACAQANISASRTPDIVTKHIFHAASENHIQFAHAWEEVASE